MTDQRAAELALTLAPMTADELERFIREEIADCARQRAEEDGNRGGLTPDTLARAEREIATILRWERDAFGTVEHLLLAARTPAGATVGWLWLKLPPPGRWAGSGFLCQMTVACNRRRRGYGRAMLVALERDLAARGMTELRLNVWEENDAAKALYAAAGYTLVQRCETLRQLCKPLPPLDAATARGAA
jgi:ribosomal protein S18 acetylase RimI-like enzyme